MTWASVKKIPGSAPAHIVIDVHVGLIPHNLQPPIFYYFWIIYLESILVYIPPWTIFFLTYFCKWIHISLNGLVGAYTESGRAQYAYPICLHLCFWEVSVVRIKLIMQIFLSSIDCLTFICSARTCFQKTLSRMEIQKLYSETPPFLQYAIAIT